MLGTKAVSRFACNYLPRLQRFQEKLYFYQATKFRPVSSYFIPLAKQGQSTFSIAITEVRRFGSTSTIDPSVDNALSSSAPLSSSPIQQLYKSNHRGRGGVSVAKTRSSNPLKFEPTSAHVKLTAELIPSRSSCSTDSGPIPERPLTPLQKRQLLFKDKAAFVLTPQALRRLKYLISQYKGHNQPSPTIAPNGTSKQEQRIDSSTEKPAGIRIGVRRRGCSGYSYTVNYYFANCEGDGDRKDLNLSAASSLKQKASRGGLGDVTVEQDGVKVVVDGNALFYVLGTEMDYVIRNVEEKFTFKNPNQKYSCGCEESFMPFGEDDLDDD